ncbi:uncharacterized protein ACO6RY_03088 [Pungitius sinensis]
MTRGLMRRESEGAPERVAAAGNGKQLQRSSASIGRRGEIELLLKSDLKEETDAQTHSIAAEGLPAESIGSDRCSPANHPHEI